MPADPLGDLTTSSNILSAWQITDDRANLEQVTAALAATCTTVDNFDYALFDQQLVAQLSIDVEEIPGETPDTEANSWHRHLVHLSGEKLLELAHAMWAHAITDRRSAKEIKRLLVEALESGRIDWKDLQEGVTKDITLYRRTPLRTTQR